MMKQFVRSLGAIVALGMGVQLHAEPNTRPSVFTIDSDNVIEIDGQRVFPIGFTLAPEPGAKAPDGREGLAVLADAGGLLIRTGPHGDENHWDAAAIEAEKQWQAAAARNGLYCMPWLHELASIPPGSVTKEKKLKQIVDMFRDNPGMGYWKGADEPQWGKIPVANVQRAYEIIKQEDPNHPVWLVQAPRGTVAQLKEYVDSYDIGGMDIYPVSVPMGSHAPAMPNKTISLVGDFTKIMMEVQENRKPLAMTLQIAWSGVAKLGKKLVFPTAMQERFMAYEAIIDGSRGLTFFGGQLPTTLNERDRALGWNWTFWDHVLGPLMKEIGNNSPLQPALVAPDAKLPIRCKGPGMEYLVRQTPDALYILACKRQGNPIQAEFSGLPNEITRGTVMFEGNRIISLNRGTFTDSFGPFDVHVYRFSR